MQWRIQDFSDRGKFRVRLTRREYNRTNLKAMSCPLSRSVNEPYALVTLNWPRFFPSPILFQINLAYIERCRCVCTELTDFLMGYPDICFWYRTRKESQSVQCSQAITVDSNCPIPIRIVSDSDNITVHTYGNPYQNRTQNGNRIGQWEHVLVKRYLHLTMRCDSFVVGSPIPLLAVQTNVPESSFVTLATVNFALLPEYSWKYDREMLTSQRKLR